MAELRQSSFANALITINVNLGVKFWFIDCDLGVTWIANVPCGMFFIGGAFYIIVT